MLRTDSPLAQRSWKQDSPQSFSVLIALFFSPSLTAFCHLGKKHHQAIESILKSNNVILDENVLKKSRSLLFTFLRKTIKHRENSVA